MSDTVDTAKKFSNKFTFAVCAYKNSPFLEEAVLSAVKQSVPVKIIIATSTPSEYIENIALKYNIPYFVNPESKGIASDWEFALSQIKTPFGAILHQDDIYFPDYAENVIKKFQKNPDALIAFTDYGDLTSDGKIHPFRFYLWVKRFLLWAFYLKRVHRTKFFKLSATALGNAICCPAVSYNINKVAPLKFDRNYSVNLDWAMWLELAKREGAFVYIPKILMAHRISDSMESSAAISDSRRYNEDFALFSTILGKKIAGLLMKFYKKSYDSCVQKKQ